MLSEIESRLVALIEERDREMQEIKVQIHRLAAQLESVHDRLHELSSALASLQDQLSP